MIVLFFNMFFFIAIFLIQKFFYMKNCTWYMFFKIKYHYEIWIIKEPKQSCYKILKIINTGSNSDLLFFPIQVYKNRLIDRDLRVLSSSHHLLPDLCRLEPYFSHLLPFGFKFRSMTVPLRSLLPICTRWFYVTYITIALPHKPVKKIKNKPIEKFTYGWWIFVWLGS